MSDQHFQQSISVMQTKIEDQEKEIASKKRLVNMLCIEAGIDAIYNDVDAIKSNSAKIRPDQFYRKKTATAMREYLESRKHIGPSTVDEIFNALKTGGFEFESKRDAIAKRGISIALGKNSSTFKRLPNSETFGLATWYDEDDSRTNGKASPKKTITKEDEADIVEIVEKVIEDNEQPATA